MNHTGVLPWHNREWQRIQAQIDSDRLPHGLLVTGPEDAGKDMLVEHLAAYLLCSGSIPVCGECGQCQLLAAGTHPDLLLVSPEESKQIKIEQVRSLIEWAMQTAQQGGRKICVIEPADKLNLQSANALLKVLEEPPSGTIICLVTSHPSRLLPTLRSRCQIIDCLLPVKEEALAWLAIESSPDNAELLLEIAEGNPLRALRTIDDNYLALRQQIAKGLSDLTGNRVSPLQIAADLAKEDPDRVLGIAYQLIADSISSTMTHGQVVKNSDLSSAIDSLSTRSLDERYALLDRTGRARGLLNSTSNPNVQMMMEWVLLGKAS